MLRPLGELEEGKTVTLKKVQKATTLPGGRPGIPLCRVPLTDRSPLLPASQGILLVMLKQTQALFNTSLQEVQTLSPGRVRVRFTLNVCRMQEFWGGQLKPSVTACHKQCASHPAAVGTAVRGCNCFLPRAHKSRIIYPTGNIAYKGDIIHRINIILYSG